MERLAALRQIGRRINQTVSPNRHFNIAPNPNGFMHPHCFSRKTKTSVWVVGESHALSTLERSFLRRDVNRFGMLLVLMFNGVFAAAGVQQKEMPHMAKMDMQMMMKDCPMALPDTNLATSDTEAGIA